MEKITKNDEKIVFKHKASETLANSIRRYLNQVPVLAVDEIEITKNDSALYDETLAHRIGLIPLKSENLKKNPEEEITLEAKGEKKVYSGDFEGKVKIVYENMLLTQLLKNQGLKLKAFVRAGKGTEHSKFSPGLMFYRKISEISLDKNLLEEVEQILPDKELSEKGNKIIIKDDGEKEIADVCEGIASKRKKEVSIKFEDELVITVESFGQMSPENMVKKSIEVLKKDLESVSKGIEKL